MHGWVADALRAPSRRLSVAKRFSAIIPADLLEELTREPLGADGKRQPSKLREALALDYRQRFKNKAIDVQPLRTPGAWATYIIKEIDVTTHRLKGRSPCYASQSAKRAASELYEGTRRWLAAWPVLSADNILASCQAAADTWSWPAA